jgi:putative membrane-bound dehydrogenase-like protein
MDVKRGVRTFNLAVIVLVAVVSLSAAARAADNPIYDSETDLSTQRLSPEEAAKAFKVPEGFKVQVFAAEPEVQNPIAMSWDGRGRLWIAENYTYAERGKKFDLGLRDRILIFTDKDGDGKHDERKVFTEEVQMLTGIEVGKDGIWVIAPPRLLFIPDKDQDDVPDGPAVTMLDGFDIPAENYHNFANGIKFGPDGWLYGRCGASAPGMLGKPGTPMEERVPLRGGIWRYHPFFQRVEVLCYGTTNPWGHDWNEYGELFFINTVNGHLWHLIPGAHLVRAHTIDPNPRAYELIDTHADHYHWDNSKDWTDSRGAKGKHDDLGGGHAHIGCTIYQGDNWPEQYRGKLMTLNQHGRRINVDRLERDGSGYTGRHEPDILKSADPWFRGIELSYGPDGGVYILDWSDTGECHDHTGVHRTSGRIYKVTYGDPKRVPPFDFAKMSSDELVAAHRHPNEWWARQARREVIRRMDDPDQLEPIVGELRSMLLEDTTPVIQLRASFTLNAVGRMRRTVFGTLVNSTHESLRSWAYRLTLDYLPIDIVTGPSSRTARNFEAAPYMNEMMDPAADASRLVQLAAASGLQRLPLAERTQVAAKLIAKADIADDHNLPLMIWYGISPLADSNPEELAELLTVCRVPLLRQFMARALAEKLDRNPRAMNHLLYVARHQDAMAQSDIIQGLAAGLAGWQRAAAPSQWAHFSETASKQVDEATKLKLNELNALFGDGRALGEIRKVALDSKADMQRRQSALQSLIQQKDPELRSVCEKLLDVRFLNTHAARGLATFDDPAIGAALVKAYRKFHPTERPAVLDALSSRPTFVPSLLEQLEKGQIPKSDLTASQARQIVSLGKADLTERLTKAWGDIRESSADAQADIARWKKDLTPVVLAEANMGQGRAVFNKICGNCHRLHGQGAEIGPDLTGAGRQNIDYLLGNIIAPADVVPVDYRLTVVALTDGRVLNGIKVAETDRTITLQLANAKQTIEKSEIEAIKPSTQSLMPDGLLKTLSDEEVRSLIAYLQHPTQVPLP